MAANCSWHWALFAWCPFLAQPVRRRRGITTSRTATDIGSAASIKTSGITVTVAAIIIVRNIAITAVVIGMKTTASEFGSTYN